MSKDLRQVVRGAALSAITQGAPNAEGSTVSMQPRIVLEDLEALARSAYGRGMVRGRESADDHYARLGESLMQSVAELVVIALWDNELAKLFHEVRLALVDDGQKRADLVQRALAVFDDHYASLSALAAAARDGDLWRP